jgi:hypothetical protein
MSYKKEKIIFSTKMEELSNSPVISAAELLGALSSTSAYRFIPKNADALSPEANFAIGLIQCKEFQANLANPVVSGSVKDIERVIREDAIALLTIEQVIMAHATRYVKRMSKLSSVDHSCFKDKYIFVFSVNSYVFRQLRLLNQPAPSCIELSANLKSYWDGVSESNAKIMAEVEEREARLAREKELEEEATNVA